MTKYYLSKKGYGKAGYLIVKPCSDSKARKLKSQGVEIFNSRDDAIEEIRKRWSTKDYTDHGLVSQFI